MSIHKHLDQVKALVADAQGELDALVVGAQDIHKAAAALEDKVKELETVSAAVAAKQAELAGVEASLKQAKKAFEAFKNIASKG